MNLIRLVGYEHIVFIINLSKIEKKGGGSLNFIFLLSRLTQYFLSLDLSLKFCLYSILIEVFSYFFSISSNLKLK